LAFSKTHSLGALLDGRLSVCKSPSCVPSGAAGNQNGSVPLSGAINRRNTDDNTHNCLGRRRGLCPRNCRHSKRGYADC